MTGMAVGSTALGKSLMYVKKSRGPKMDICGIPCVICDQLDCVLMFEYWFVIWTIWYIICS
jgi:hypothetical protein